MTNQVVVNGTVTADGTLELAGPVGLPPGPVEVTVTARAAPTGEPTGKDWWVVLQELRVQREASGIPGRTREEIDEEIRQMRDEAEEEMQAIERLHEECRRLRGAAPDKGAMP
jgi:hypothetical protein